MKNLNLRVETESLTHMTDVDISNLFGPYFEEITCRFQRIDEDRYARYRNECPHKIVSMDPLYHGDYNLGISRLYNPDGTKFLGHFYRPETGMTLLQQFRQIPRGIKVVIFEDDIGYGGQIRRVKRILAKMDIEVVDVFTLYDNKDLVDEVLDVRDFIFGADFGGLVVQDLDTNGRRRVPYLYPFIDVKARCSIDSPIEFSLNMWKFNRSIYEGYPNSKQVKPMLRFFDDMIRQCEEELK